MLAEERKKDSWTRIVSSEHQGQTCHAWWHMPAFLRSVIGLCGQFVVKNAFCCHFEEMAPAFFERAHAPERYFLSKLRFFWLSSALCLSVAVLSAFYPVSAVAEQRRAVSSGL